MVSDSQQLFSDVFLLDIYSYIYIFTLCPNRMAKRFVVGDLALCAEANGLYYLAKLKQTRTKSGVGAIALSHWHQRLSTT
jgi:hypothetical protein